MPISLQIAVNLVVFRLAKFDLVAVIQVGDVSPGGFTHLAALFRRNTQFGSAFLEL